MSAILGQYENPWDVAVIGAGPVGLYAASMCGLLGLETIVFEALPHIGGQCSSLYPQKTLYGVPGFVGATAQALSERLFEQAKLYVSSFQLGTKVSQLEPVRLEEGETAPDGNVENVRTEAAVGSDTGVKEPEGRVGGLGEPQEAASADSANGKESTGLVHALGWRLVASENEVFAKTVLIAVGMGSFEPNRADLEGQERFEGKHVHYHVSDVERFRDQILVIAGGGDAAVDWTLELVDKAKAITLVHRRETFRCAPSSLARLEEKERQGRVTLLRSHQLVRLEGGDTLQTVVARHADGEVELPADHLLIFFGLLPKRDELLSWGLELAQQRISVDPRSMATSRPGIYAVGDAVHYDGKVHLLTAGFGEAVTAAYHIKGRLCPSSTPRKDVSSLKH